jgi:peptide deformylase
MTIRNIVTLPDPVLRQVSAPIKRVDADVRRLAEDMLETMYDAPGIGLAAIQVGIARRLIVLDVAGGGDDEDAGAKAARQPIVMINPEIITSGDELRVHEEGCLSIPDIRFEIERPSMVEVRYVDLDGNTITKRAEGLLATAIQHEIDHLNGRMIIDYMSRLKRDMIIRRFKKQARGVID